MKRILNVLHIEDNENDSLLVKKELKDSGYQINYKLIDNEESLRDELTQLNWDIILSDFTMPSFSGMEALIIIRKFNKSIPVIFVSATMDNLMVSEAEKAGANGFVDKKELNKLSRVIDNVLI